MFSLNNLLNRINMYRVAIYYLATLLLWALALSFFGVLPYSAQDIFLPAVYLVILCWAVNLAFAKVLKLNANPESAFISALILALITGPLPLFPNLLFFSFIAAAAMASKYIFAWKKVHIFNPAAFAVLASVFVLGQGASWWVAGVYMAPVVILGGIAVIQKLDYWRLVGAFLAAYFLLSAVFNFQNFSSAQNLFSFVWQLLVFSPILYFAAIMLPEPQTAPKAKNPRIFYGILTAVVLVLAQTYLSVPYTLEASLLAGNFFAWALYRDKRYILNFVKREEAAPGIYNFWFKPGRKLHFRPGQFFEWTVYHKNSDSRGIRRYFTIASSPREENVMISAKIPENPSAFKEKLLNLKEGERVSIVGPQGEFTLPRETEGRKFAFIAGGIGITPFRSIIKYMLEEDISADIALLYSASDNKEFVFGDIFKSAEEKFGLSVNYVTGHVAGDIIKEKIPDYSERIFYISGPDPMVRNTEKILADLGVKSENIKTDYFSGYEEI